MFCNSRRHVLVAGVQVEPAGLPMAVDRAGRQVALRLPPAEAVQGGTWQYGHPGRLL